MLTLKPRAFLWAILLGRAAPRSQRAPRRFVRPGAADGLAVRAGPGPGEAWLHASRPAARPSESRPRCPQGIDIPCLGPAGPDPTPLCRPSGRRAPPPTLVETRAGGSGPVRQRSRALLRDSDPRSESVAGLGMRQVRCEARRLGGWAHPRPGRRPKAGARRDWMPYSSRLRHGLLYGPDQLDLYGACNGPDELQVRHRAAGPSGPRTDDAFTYGWTSGPFPRPWSLQPEL
jgi:hypothetical protein